MNKLECNNENLNKDRKLVIVIGTDKYGEGDDKWSDLLMESYIYALSESHELPTELIFYNSGVKLTSQGSNVIESLELLQSKGVKILSCGACVEFYGLSGKLMLGEEINMYEIVDIMNSASNTIKI